MRPTTTALTLNLVVVVAILRFEVSEGLITVTLSDGTKTTADIEESMLSPEILARMLLLQMHRTKRMDSNSEHSVED